MGGEIVKNASGTTLLTGGGGASDPAAGAAAVTPSDSATLSGVRGLWVGTGGNVALTLGETNVILKNVPDGTLIPVSPVKVRSTSTTASDIVALS